MKKEKKILLYFISFIIGLLTTMLVGISGVFALTYNDIGYIYDNTDVMIDVTYETANQAPMYIERNQVIYTQLKIMNVFIENYQFQANRHYQIEMEFLYETLKYADLYQVYDQDNNSCSISYTYSNFNTKWATWDFSCPKDTNRIYLKVYNSTNTAITDMAEWSWSYTFLRYTEAPIDSTESENTDKIINNNNENTDKIIESNKETQEVIKDQFNSCHDSYNLFDKNNLIRGYVSSVTGNVQTGGTSSVTTQIINLPQDTYTITGARLEKICYYDNNSTFISCEIIDKTKYTFTLQDYTNIRLQFLTSSINDIMLNKGSTELPYEPYGEKICTNKLDEQNQTLQGIQGALTDESIPDVSKLGDVVGVLPPGPVDSILTLPLTMLNNLMTNLNGTCNQVEIELPYVKRNITLPCIKSLYDKMGVTGTIFTSVGLIASAFILFNYLLNLYKWVDDTLTLRENTMPGYFEDKWGGGA